MDMEKLTKLGRKVLPLKRCGAVIVAAGSASRMGGIDKVMAPWAERPWWLARLPPSKTAIPLRKL